MANERMNDMLERYGMVDVVRGYGSYSGIADSMVGRTQFIIKSAGI